MDVFVVVQYKGPRGLNLFTFLELHVLKIMCCQISTGFWEGSVCVWAKVGDNGNCSSPGFILKFSARLRYRSGSYDTPLTSCDRQTSQPITGYHLETWRLVFLGDVQCSCSAHVWFVLYRLIRHKSPRKRRTSETTMTLTWHGSWSSGRYVRSFRQPSGVSCC